MTNPIAGRWYPIEDKAMWPKEERDCLFLFENGVWSEGMININGTRIYPESKYFKERGLTHFMLIPTLAEQQEREKIKIKLADNIKDMATDNWEFISFEDNHLLNESLSLINQL